MDEYVKDSKHFIADDNLKKLAEIIHFSDLLSMPSDFLSDPDSDSEVEVEVELKFYCLPILRLVRSDVFDARVELKRSGQYAYLTFLKGSVFIVKSNTADCPVVAQHICSEEQLGVALKDCLIHEGNGKKVAFVTSIGLKDVFVSADRSTFYIMNIERQGEVGAETFNLIKINMDEVKSIFFDPVGFNVDALRG